MHAGVAAEQADPERGRERRGAADREADRHRREGAGPGDAPRARRLPGADMRADQDDQRLADGEHDRHQKQLEPHADAVAGEGAVPNVPTQPVRMIAAATVCSAEIEESAPTRRISRNSRHSRRQSPSRGRSAPAQTQAPMIAVARPKDVA